jgi:hypothetical protein
MESALDEVIADQARHVDEKFGALNSSPNGAHALFVVSWRTAPARLRRRGGPGAARADDCPSQPSSAARIAWCTLRCLARAILSIAFHTSAGNRTERAIVGRDLPRPG